MHPTTMRALATARAADAERARRHAPLLAERRLRTRGRPGLVRARRRLGTALVAVGERVAAEPPRPRSRGAPSEAA